MSKQKKIQNKTDLEKRIELILIEETNTSVSVENFIEKSTVRLYELFVDERIYGKK